MHRVQSTVIQSYMSNTHTHARTTVHAMSRAVVTNPLAATYLRGTMDHPLSAADKAAKEDHQVRPGGPPIRRFLCPLLARGVRGFEAKAVDLIKAITTHGAAHSPHQRHEILEDLVGGVSGTIQRGSWSAHVHSVSHMRLPV